jgi:hypothetical protein
MLGMYTKGMLVKRSQYHIDTYGQTASAKREIETASVGEIIALRSIRENGKYTSVYTVQFNKDQIKVLHPESLIGLTPKEAFQYKLGNLK